MGEARDHLTAVEQNAAAQLSHKNLQLNEQAAQTMSEMKSAQIFSEAQDHRIKELNAELLQMKSHAEKANNSFIQAASDLNVANNLASNYKKQLDALTQQTMDMQKNADLQRKDFEREIEKLRREQNEAIRLMKSQPPGGTLGPGVNLEASRELPVPSQSLRLEYPERASGSGQRQQQHRRDHTSDADDENEDGHLNPPPGLRPGGDPPGDDGDDSDDGDRRKRDKKKKKDKKKKSSRGRSRRRRRDPSSSPSSSSSSRSSSSSESSFARKVRKAVVKSQSSSTNKAKESDRILVPKFPQPENYRNWRIRVRDAVIAASSKPDLAFHWIEEVFKRKKVIRCK